MRLIKRPYLLGEDTCEPMISFTVTPTTSDTSEQRLSFWDNESMTLAQYND